MNAFVSNMLHREYRQKSKCVFEVFRDVSQERSNLLVELHESLGHGNEV